MTTALDRPGAGALVLNVGATLALVLVLNGLIFALGWDEGGGAEPRIDLPGLLVPGAWTVLFVLLGVARWLLLRSGGGGAGAVTVLIAFCAAWPLYALTTGSPVPGLLGNLGAIALAGWTAAWIRRRSPLAAALVLPVALWVSFATLVVDWWA